MHPSVKADIVVAQTIEATIQTWSDFFIFIFLFKLLLLLAGTLS